MFSEVYDSILMWAYYAKSHQGVCIEFDLSLLDPDEELNKQILYSISKVHYSPIRADRLTSSTKSNGLNFLISKADVWAHEHEWRIVCETEAEYLPFDCISKVYLGVNFDKNTAKYKTLLKAIDTYESLSVVQCHLSREKFQIETKEVYNSYINTLAQKHNRKKNNKQLAML